MYLVLNVFCIVYDETFAVVFVDILLLLIVVCRVSDTSKNLLSVSQHLSSHFTMIRHNFFIHISDWPRSYQMNTFFYYNTLLGLRLLL